MKKVTIFCCAVPGGGHSLYMPANETARLDRSILDCAPIVMEDDEVTAVVLWGKPGALQHYSIGSSLRIYGVDSVCVDAEEIEGRWGYEFRAA